jgi:hypothetical protein
MFAENKAEYNWLRFLEEKCMTFNKVTNPNGKIKNHLFYLTNTMQFLYICDFLTDLEEVELIELANKEENSVVIGYSDGEFAIIHDGWESKKFELTSRSNSFLCKCDSCNKFWFGNLEGLYSCSSCGVYDGGHLPDGTTTGDCRLW